MEDLKLGMIGLDTSHVVAFTKLLHNAESPHYVPGGRLVAAFPGGSQAMANSRDRVGGFTDQLRDEFGVTICDSIEVVCEQVDAVLLESVDGRQHLEQFEKIAPAAKPVFIDKPLTCDLDEAKAIIALSDQHDAPFFSASSLRFSKGIAELAAGKRVVGCQSFGPAAILDDFPGLFWYGIHSAEILFAKMGAGCRRVRVTKTDLADLVTGVWDDGRIGTLLGFRYPKEVAVGDFGCTIFAEGGIVHGTPASEPPGYAMLLGPMIEFFRTRIPPIAPQETLEIIAFLAAANESRETGAEVQLAV
jgi:hypothetical protein